MPPGVLFGQFWAPASECPKECFLSVFWAKKHSKSTLRGTPRQVPKIAQKALRGALSGPGPKSTPVNGGRDRKAWGLTLFLKRRNEYDSQRPDKIFLYKFQRILDGPAIRSGWPGPSAETCRGFVVYKFLRILPGIFVEDFSGPFFPVK